MILTDYLGARGTLIHEKKLRSKILCQTPFNAGLLILGKVFRLQKKQCLSTSKETIQLSRTDLSLYQYFWLSWIRKWAIKMMWFDIGIGLSCYIKARLGRTDADFLTYQVRKCSGRGGQTSWSGTIVAMPSPMLTVNRIRIWPYWKRVLNVDDLCSK